MVVVGLPKQSPTTTTGEPPGLRQEGCRGEGSLAKHYATTSFSFSNVPNLGTLLTCIYPYLGTWHSS